MTDTSISTQIYASRDAIRSQITDYIKEYLELQGVDLTKSSFLSFIIDVVSTLTGNLMFYQMSTYREFFLTKAQLSESILNLGAFLGYSPADAEYATADVLVTIPLTFTEDAEFDIASGFRFYASDIQFTTDYTTTISIIGNSTVVITLVKDSKRYTLPYTKTDDDFSFILPVKQFQPDIQEFQIDADLDPYQFVTIDVPITGKVSTMVVQVKGPGDPAFTTWTEYDSLYLMSDSNQGYVRRRTDGGVKLYFGNGLIGVQPPAGSTVKITSDITLGASGNVITGSIKTGDRLYNAVGGVTQIVNYTNINTSPASGGVDEESLEETRRNAIASITTLGRLVTEDDYSKVDVVASDSPLSQNSISVLKRSDMKINDIQLFTSLFFGTDPDDATQQLIVPTRNASHIVDRSTATIPRSTSITINDVEYYTLFDLVIDLINTSASYYYTIDETKQTPTLITSYSSEYDIYANNLVVKKIGTAGKFTLSYYSTESDVASATCEMEVGSTGVTYTMVNDSTSEFSYSIDPYSFIPEGLETYYFTIKDPSSNNVAKYQNTIVFRQSLDDFMMSSLVDDSTANITIYDIPVIKKSYYDALDTQTFESQILQSLLTTLDFTQYRMLTDFTNLKFSNTTGVLSNIQHNEITKPTVIDVVDSLPTSPTLDDKYALSDQATSYAGYIATCTDATADTWHYLLPATDDIVNVTNEGVKYIYSLKGWIPIPNYTIPLELDIEVFKDADSTLTISGLSQTIKTALVSAFSSRFGSNVAIYRSEIIDVIQGVTGVDHCRLISPVTSIFFNYDIDDFSQTELLEYGPEYVYFRAENITVRIVG